eukprot:CAMPEP_0172674954 /NCGR_PEP_ID=MMETSP1074-20121228/13012_1 /TAXON_ID=2916 /ORGANISM="Ceratium fusus, Strain PA161109" /LENGTH=245 /DNA_ID=CAMNT_0013492397 /DNA_START=86 /DNA_END=823 /DNA_ORIENTATION=+
MTGTKVMEYAVPEEQKEDVNRSPVHEAVHNSRCFRRAGLIAGLCVFMLLGAACQVFNASLKDSKAAHTLGTQLLGLHFISQGEHTVCRSTQKETEGGALSVMLGGADQDKVRHTTKYDNDFDADGTIMVSKDSFEDCKEKCRDFVERNTREIMAMKHEDQKKALLKLRHHGAVDKKGRMVSCKGIEFRSSKQRCEIWFRRITHVIDVEAYYKKHTHHGKPDFQCYTFHPDTSLADRVNAASAATE